MLILIKWLLYALVIYAMAHIIPGIIISGFADALITAFIMGLVNVFVSPLVKLLSLPLTIITFGLFIFVINALMLLLVSYLSPGFEVSTLLAGFLGSIFIAVLSFFIEKITVPKEIETL